MVLCVLLDRVQSASSSSLVVCFLLRISLLGHGAKDTGVDGDRRSSTAESRAST